MAGYVSVDVSVDDILEELSDSDLIAELETRGIDPSGLGVESSKSVVRRAITLMQRGENIDAMTELERFFFPKWETITASEKAYKEAMRQVQ